MSERHLHDLNPIRIVEKAEEALMMNGIRGLLVFTATFAMCPGDDIALIGGAIFSNNPQIEVETQRAIMPPDDQYELRLPEVSKNGERSLKPKPLKK